MLKKATQILLLSGALLASWDVQAASQDSQYHAALAQIKLGHYDQGLPILKQLMLKNPSVLRYRYDYLAALGWAQRDDEVLALSRTWPINGTLPTYVLEAIGRSARVKGQFDRSCEAYDAVLKKEPHRIYSQVGHALAKLGQGYSDEAEKLMVSLKNQVGFRQELERGFLDYYLSRPELNNKAVEFMADLRKRYPDNKGYIYQEITVLVWAGHWAEALDHAKSLSKDSLPPYMLETLGRAARGMHQYSRSLAYYEESIQKEPRRIESRVGYVMSLIDEIQDRRQVAPKMALRLAAELDTQDPSTQSALDEKEQVAREKQQLELAIQLLEPLNPLQQSRLDVKEAWLRLQDTLRQDDYKILKAARAIQEQHNPKHLAAATAEIDALNRQGAPHLAAMHPMFEQVRTALKWDVELNEVGQEIRSGQANYDAQVGEARYQKSEEALKHANGIREALLKSDFPERQSFVDRLDYDRMIVLNDLRRPEDVIQIYQDLESRHVSMPYYAYVAAASSYLSTHSTAKARDVFEKALELKPRDATATLGLYYAYLDNAQYEEALYIANWEIPLIKRDARATSAMAYAYTDYLNLAEERMENLVKEFPADYELHKNLATVYRYRDKPRQADEQYKWIAGALPNDHGVQVGRVYTNLATRDYREAEKSLEKAEALAPREADVKKARRDFETHNLRELNVSAGYANGTPSGSVGGQRASEPQVSWRLNSQPLNYDWRLFTEGKVLSERMPAVERQVFAANGVASTQRNDAYKTNTYYTGVGVEYRRPDNKTELSLGGTRFSNDAPIAQDPQAAVPVMISSKNRVHVAGNYEHNFDDHWSVEGTAEYNSLNTPLKATQRAFFGNRLAVGLTWAANESRRARLGLDFSRFDDGNKRWAWFAGWSERIVSRPTYKLTASLDVSIDGNSLPSADAAYYNPERESYVGLGIDQEWVIDRFYDKSWKHRLGLTAGKIYQRGYGSSSAAGVRYEHSWAFDDRTDLNIGIGRNRRSYDGLMEYRNTANSTFNWRF